MRYKEIFENINRRFETHVKIMDAHTQGIKKLSFIVDAFHKKFNKHEARIEALEKNIVDISTILESLQKDSHAPQPIPPMDQFRQMQLQLAALIGENDDVSGT
jgi:archaellum component FlaC